MLEAKDLEAIRQIMKEEIKKKKTLENSRVFIELPSGFEPPTSALPISKFTFYSIS